MSCAARTARTRRSPITAALWANFVMVSWRPASAANLAFFKWFGVDQPAFCSPLQRLCAEIGRPEIALRGDTRSSLRIVVDRTRETCDHRNLPAPWIPTRSSKPLRPLGHLLCGNAHFPPIGNSKSVILVKVATRPDQTCHGLKLYS